MKKLVGEEVGSYSFNAATRQITISGIDRLDLEQFLLITNVTRNIIIYNFADPSLGGTLSGSVLTLTYDTSVAMSNTDRLQIFIIDRTDDQYDMLSHLKMLRKLLESSAVVDSAMRQKVVVESIIGTSLGISTTGMDSGVGIPTTNRPSALAPVSAPSAVYWQPVWIGPVDQRYQIIDAATAAYNLGIRSKLSFA
jgi:hypothetical protein